MPVYELLSTSDLTNVAHMLETLNSFLIVFDMFNDKKDLILHSASNCSQGCNEITERGA